MVLMDEDCGVGGVGRRDIAESSCRLIKSSLALDRFFKGICRELQHRTFRPACHCVLLPLFNRPLSVYV